MVQPYKFEYFVIECYVVPNILNNFSSKTQTLVSLQSLINRGMSCFSNCLIASRLSFLQNRSTEKIKYLNHLFYSEFNMNTDGKTKGRNPYLNENSL